jgi:hypothetical protein
MTLLKSKINSLAWLKSTIYVSVIGGGILSSFTPALAATLVGYDDTDPNHLAISVTQDVFGNGRSTLTYPAGKRWKATFDIDEINGKQWDTLVIRVYLQHIDTPHLGDSNLGRQLNLNFRSESFQRHIIEQDYDFSEHPGVKHSDTVWGWLVPNIVNRVDDKTSTDIKDWSLVVFAEHKVPEPTTMLGTAVALGWGGWMKRKNSIKQNKTKSQG